MFQKGVPIRKFGSYQADLSPEESVLAENKQVREEQVEMTGKQ